MLDFSERLYTLLASPYAYIQIRTYEEARFVETVASLASNMGRQVVEWSPGLDGEVGLVQLLQRVPQLGASAVVILKDAHPYLSSAPVVRLLRELEPRLTEGGGCLVFVSPFVELPRELLKDVTFLDAPLPGRVELHATLDDVFGEAELPEPNRSRLIAGALGLTLREASRAFHRARFEWQLAGQKGAKTFDLEAAVVREKRRLIEADRILEFCELDSRLDDVGGLATLKRWLMERRLAFSEEAAEFGLPAPKGVLLTGVQGCGKSLFAKAVAGYWGIPLLRMDIGRLFDGSSSPEAALSRAIATAEALSPAVLWIDEIDKAFADQGGSVSRMMSSLLSWLQDKTDPVFCVATANRVMSLPPELLRKGRFDEIFFVDLPDKAARLDILRIHLTRRGRPPERFDLDSIAEATQYFSGAELEQVVVAGLFKAFAQSRDLTQGDLMLVAEQTVPLYRTYEEDIKAQREWAATRARAAAHDKSLLDYFQRGASGAAGGKA